MFAKLYIYINYFSVYICMYIYICLYVIYIYIYTAKKINQLASVTTTDDPGTTIQSQRPAMRAAEC